MFIYYIHYHNILQLQNRGNWPRSNSRPIKFLVDLSSETVPYLSIWPENADLIVNRSRYRSFGSHDLHSPTNHSSSFIEPFTDKAAPAHHYLYYRAWLLPSRAALSGADAKISVIFHIEIFPRWIVHLLKAVVTFQHQASQTAPKAYNFPSDSQRIVCVGIMRLSWCSHTAYFTGFPALCHCCCYLLCHFNRCCLKIQWWSIQSSRSK